MPDTVIVTARYGIEEADFELPAKLPLLQWRDAFTAALRQGFYGIRLEGKILSLYWQDRLIPGEATLEQCGIYDGSVITLRLEG